MKQKTYYEILGVAPHVSSGQIQAAYRFARTLYMGESAPSHGLLDADERAMFLTQVEEAYACLSNPSTRRDYDVYLQQTSPRRTASHSPPAAPIASAPPAPGPTEATPDPKVHAADESEPLRVPDVVNGAALRKLRESRRLSIDQIAALSKVGSRFLQALEEDRHAALPGRVFARGFLIEYARAIRVSEADLVERYLRQWRPR